MPGDNVETVRRAFDALGRDGVDGLIPFIHRDFEASTPPELSLEPTTYRGHAGIRRYFETFYEVMDEIRYEPEEMTDVRGRVVVPTRLVARGRGTGIETAQRVTLVFTLGDERIIHIAVYPTKAEALAAVAVHVE